MSDSIGKLWVFCPECDDVFFIALPEDETKELECSICSGPVDMVYNE